MTKNQRFLHSSRRQCPSAARSGLAPLELVLALPLLLSMMALIVNFAHLATWKVRSATNARLAMWRHRPMWNADRDPKPANYWPQGAALGVDSSSRISPVDPIWNQPDIAQAWIKGPVFAAGDGYLGLRDNRVNEMSEGVANGKGDLSLRYPFLPAMGKMSLNVRHTLLDSVWQFHTMGYGDNNSRRAKDWWKLEDAPEWAQQKQVFLQADAIMTGNPQRGLLRPLDRDNDLYSNGYQYDFYGRMRSFCENDPAAVRQNYVVNDGGLVDDIQGRGGNPHVAGVCERMSRSYRKMYQDKLAALLAAIAQLEGQLASLQSQLGQFQSQLSQLQSQLAQLQSAVPVDPAQIAQTQAQINQTQGQISQTQSQIGQTQSQIDDLNMQGGQLKKWIQELTDFINTF